MPNLSSSKQNTDVQMMLASAGWQVLHARLVARRNQLVEKLVVEESPEVRGSIHGIDQLFTEILNLKNESYMEKFEPKI